MARLPDYVNERSISTGSEFMRPRTTTDRTSTAAQGLASTISQLGGQLQAIDDRLDAKAKADAERVSKLETEADVIRTDTAARLELQRHKDNISESGAGFFDNYMKWYDKNWQERVAAMPAERRLEAQNKFLRDRETLAVSAAGIEADQRKRFVLTVSNEKRTSLTTAVKAGEMDHTAAKADADNYVTSLNLPPNATSLLRREMGMAVDSAHVERLIATNPDGALRELRKYSSATPRSQNPHVQTVIEAAQRNNIPLEIMLPIVKGESNFDPNADMSKKINPQTGKPYSSAYGLGQMIDSNWKETGIPKTSDPALQAEAVARLLSKRISVLQSNGIDVTPANVWGAHFVGPGGYVALQRADPSTPLRNVLLPLYGETNYRAATTGNGALLQDGATVGQTLARIKGYVDKNTAAVSGDIQQTPGSNGPVEIGGTKLGYMVGADLPRYIAKATEASQQLRGQEMKVWLKQQADDGLLNAFSSGDRKSMDKYAASTGINVAMNKGDPNAYGAAKSFVAQHKYLPKPYAEEAELALLSPDPVRRDMAYDLLSNVEINQPHGGLSQSGLTADIKKRVERFVALQTEMGMSRSQARAAIEREFDPSFADKVKRDKDRVDNIVKRQTQSAVESHFQSDRGFMGFGSTDYGTDSAKRAMTYMFQDRVRFHLDDGASEQTAVAMAKREMSRAYGVDNSFAGEKRLMHWPPNKLLPAGEDGTHKWVGDAVAGFVNDTLKANDFKFNVPTKDVYLIGTPETARTALAGQPIKYEVAYRDNRGIVQMLPGGYTVDPAAYQDKIIQQRLGNPTPPSTNIRAAREQQAAQEATYAPREGSMRRSTMPTTRQPSE